MISCLKELYKNFGFCTKSKSGIPCVVSVAEPSDWREIYSCYMEININDKNINEKIDGKSNDSFDKKGGIFTIPSQSDIKRYLAGDKDIILVSKRKPDGAINAVLHISIDDEYDGFELNMALDADKKELILDARAKGKVIYPMEFIALEDKSGQGLAYQLLSRAYDVLYKEGYIVAMLEIYTILGYWQNEEYTQINMPNIRSIKLNEAIGGFKAGELGTINYTMDNKRIAVRSEIYALPLKEGIRNMQDRITGQR